MIDWASEFLYNCIGDCNHDYVPTPNMYVEILIPKMKFSKDGAFRRWLVVTHKDGALMNGISVVKYGKHRPHRSRAGRPDRGALMPCRTANKTKKKGLLFFPDKGSTNDKPWTVFCSSSNFLFLSLWSNF